MCHHNGVGLFGAFASRVVVVPTRGVQKIQQSQGLVVLVGLHTLFKKPTAAFFKKSVLRVVPLVLDITEARAATCRHNGWFSGTTVRTRAQNVLQSRRAVVVPTRSKDATVGNIFKKLFDSCFKKKSVRCVVFRYSSERRRDQRAAQQKKRELALVQSRVTCERKRAHARRAAVDQRVQSRS